MKNNKDHLPIYGPGPVFGGVVITLTVAAMFCRNLPVFQTVMNAPVLEITENPKTPNGNKVEFNDVSFTYEGADHPALSHVSFVAESGQTVALVGSSGGGKTTAASLIPRFWDVSEGAVKAVGYHERNDPRRRRRYQYGRSRNPSQRLFDGLSGCCAV